MPNNIRKHDPVHTRKLVSGITSKKRPKRRLAVYSMKTVALDSLTFISLNLFKVDELILNLFKLILILLKLNLNLFNLL